MSERLHVHVPAPLLREVLPLLLERSLQPEVAFKGPHLDFLDAGELKGAAAELHRAGLAVTVHAPFMDLNPGALEPLVATATRRRFGQTLDAAALLGARTVVFHPGYDPWKYGGQDHLWLEQNLDFWPPLLARAEAIGCTLALENIYEREPSLLVRLLETLDSPRLGHCFDVGHWHLFAELTLEEWFARLGTRTVHVHLHDNLGKRDDHLPIGEGKIDFSALFRLLRGLTTPPTMTLEAHSREDLLRSLAAVAPLLAL